MSQPRPPIRPYMQFLFVQSGFPLELPIPRFVTSPQLFFRSGIPHHRGSARTFTAVRISRRSYDGKARRTFVLRALFTLAAIYFSHAARRVFTLHTQTPVCVFTRAPRRVFMRFSPTRQGRVRYSEPAPAGGSL